MSSEVLYQTPSIEQLDGSALAALASYEPKGYTTTVNRFAARVTPV